MTDVVNEHSVTIDEDKFFESGGTEGLTQADQTAETETAAATTDGEQNKGKVETVPYAALHEERLRRKELQEKVSKMEGTFSTLLQQIQQKQAETQQKKAEEDIPDFIENPIDHLAHKQKKIEDALKQQDAERKAHAQYNQFVHTIDNIEKQFHAANPDYYDAYNGIVDGLSEVITAVSGMTREDPRVKQAAVQEVIRIAQSTMQFGVNPAEAIYRAAPRYGYVRATAQPSKVENIAKAMEAAPSLGAAAGKAPQNLTLQSLAELSGEDFDKAWAKLIG